MTWGWSGLSMNLYGNCLIVLFTYSRVMCFLLIKSLRHSAMFQWVWHPPRDYAWYQVESHWQSENGTVLPNFGLLILFLLHFTPFHHAKAARVFHNKTLLKSCQGMSTRIVSRYIENSSLNTFSLLLQKDTMFLQSFEVLYKRVKDFLISILFYCISLAYECQLNCLKRWPVFRWKISKNPIDTEHLVAISNSSVYRVSKILNFPAVKKSFSR